MADIKYLWGNRARFPLFSMGFLKAFAKRLLTLGELLRRNWRRKKLVRLGASIHSSAEIGEATITGNKSFLTVGSLSFIGKVEMALHAEIIIGEKVCINDHVIILTASHDASDPLWRHIKKPVLIEDYAWIATGAILLPGTRIGRGAIVGAGAVVSRNIDPYQIVVGNPAKPISKRRLEKLKYNPCEYLAPNSAWLKG